jgi:hypothetical protein
MISTYQETINQYLFLSLLLPNPAKQSNPDCVHDESEAGKQAQAQARWQFQSQHA